ncbi:DUF2867 domain-containing protein [Nonomuraea sp. NPDC050478]|uniref:DUF2867 domain-containing protein n=1 Tax=Nonomuraea sp. NPDC050478 TaxID=3364365 RepID=UPI0037BD4AAF
MLSTLMERADFVDEVAVEGGGGLRAFAAGALGWEPWWVRGLFRARSVFARLLRTAHPDVRPGSGGMRPEEIPFAPGRRIGFFTVIGGEEGRELVLEASDSHLAAFLAIVADDAGGGRTRFRMITVARCHGWTGRIYLTVIRPVHYVVVRGMARAGLAASATTP